MKEKFSFIIKNKTRYFYCLFSIIFTFVSICMVYIFEIFSKIAIDKQYFLLKKAIIYMVLWFTISLFIRIMYIHFSSKYSQIWHVNINNLLMEKVLKRTPKLFNKRDRAYYVSLFNNDVEFIYENYIKSIIELISNLSVLICASIYALSINYQVCLIIFITGILLMMFTRYFSKISSQDNFSYSIEQKSYNEILNDGLYGYQTLYRYNSEDRFLDNFNNKTSILENKHLKSVKSKSKLISMINHINVSTQVIINFLTVILIYYKKIDVVYYPVVVSLMNMMMYPMQEIASDFGNIKSSKKVRAKFEEVLFDKDSENENNVIEENKELSNYKNSFDKKEKQISFVNLSFSYKDKKIFDNINFNIERKEHVLLEGESGSGKSTIFKLLTKEELLKTGSILINNIDINQIDKTEMFNQIGVISQFPMIFRASIKDNIVLFEKEGEVNTERLDYSIEKSGLKDFINSLPDGINNKLIDSGNNLSGGEKQRVEIARALYADKNILLIDEATSSLDLEKAKELEEIFRSLDKTIISICHRKDIDYSKFYDRKLQIKFGKISSAEI